MPRTFIGRERELEKLGAQLNTVKRTGHGAFLSVHGRRQVGKSRLLEEFIARSGAKAVFYTASKQDPELELGAFREAIATSSTNTAAIASAGEVGSWEAALTLLAGEATTTDPIVVVLDEFPYLIESLPAIEGIIQKGWDRTLEGRPVFLIIVGSDISTMEALTTYGRPLFGRPQEMIVTPLSPREIADMLSLEPIEALEAYLVLGGFPRLAGRWRAGDDVWKFLKRELSDPESSLIVLGERILNAEFPSDLSARAVFRAIGSDERAYTGIRDRAGVSERTLEAALDVLVKDKRVVAKNLPYSAQPRPRLSRYHVSDPYLRFWLRFIESQIPTIQRERGDVVLARIKQSWSGYQGRAIEPIVRRAIERLLPDNRFGGAMFVGGFWTRDNSVEVDLVGGREEDHAGVVDFIGSIKWRDNKVFGRRELTALTDHRQHVPGATATTLLVGVSRNGFDVQGLDEELGVADILNAYA